MPFVWRIEPKDLRCYRSPLYIWILNYFVLQPTTFGFSILKIRRSSWYSRPRLSRLEMTIFAGYCYAMTCWSGSCITWTQSIWPDAWRSPSSGGSVGTLTVCGPSTCTLSLDFRSTTRWITLGSFLLLAW